MRSSVPFPRRPASPTALLLLAAAALGGGCATPSAWQGTAPKVAGAAVLTYLDGDVEKGTTTLASLPLLTYWKTQELPGYRRSETCFLPLLFHRRSTERAVRAVRQDTGTGCPPDEASRPAAGAGDEARPRRRLRVWIPRKAAPTARSRARKRRGGKAALRGGARRRSRRPRSRALAPKPPGPWNGYTLALEGEGLVLDPTRPARETEVDFLWPLLRFARSQPGQVGFRPRVGKARVYEVGEDAFEVRVLPLFSYKRRGERSEALIWPLLGCGWEHGPDGTSLRLFYFFRVPLG